MKMKNLFFTLIALCSLGLASVNALEIGDRAPAFTLTDTNGKKHNLADFSGKVVVLEWTNHGCPFVKKHYAPGNMQKLQKEWTSAGVVWLTISSTNSGHADYQTPAQANQWLQESKAAPTAMLLDEDGRVGKLYEAKTTPHMYIIGANGTLLYQGAIDSMRTAKSEDIAKADNYVALALGEIMAGKVVTKSSTKPYGCSVKYK